MLLQMQYICVRTSDSIPRAFAHSVATLMEAMSYFYRGRHICVVIYYTGG